MVLSVIHGVFCIGRTALRFAELNGHDEVACILRVDPAVITIQESAAAGRVHEVWALMRQVMVLNESTVYCFRLQNSLFHFFFPRHYMIYIGFIY